MRPSGPFGLLSDWHGRTQYCILETDFAQGQQFLQTWLAWQNDAQRPHILHVVAIAEPGFQAQDCLLNTPPEAAVQALAQQLKQASGELQPGLHRLRLAQGQVLLTLCIGPLQAMLRKLVCEADCLRLPSAAKPSTDTLKALARHCRRGSHLNFGTPDVVPPSLEATLLSLGFQAGIQGEWVYDPPWQLKRQPLPRTQPTRALVVGAGLAGAAVAASLAQRGWQVQVIDAAPTPAAGASSLPVGLLVPHVSADDALLSRASRAGLQATLQACRQHLREGQAWQATPALREGLHIAQAAWVKPAALVQAWLAHRAIDFNGGQQVARLHYENRGSDGAAHNAASALQGAGQWQALDAQGQVLAQAPVLVLCTAWAVGQLLPTAPTHLPLDQVAGQVAYGPWSPALERAAPQLPLSGHGHFIPRVAGSSRAPEQAIERLAEPAADTAMEGGFWLSGSTYERAPLAALDAAAGLRANQERLRTLLQPTHPQASALLNAQFDAQTVHHWAGQRCTSRDRMPLAGPWHSAYPGLYVSAAMGSRGLSFAALCAELIAAYLHGEPLAVDGQVAKAMACSRFETRN